MQKNKTSDAQAHKVAFLAGTGGMLEFYDFILYILFSAQIQAQFFDSIESDYLKDIVTIAVFSVAYIVRPIGGFLVGWMGDNIGRKKSFAFTILVMSACMLLMGIMPSYAQWGIVAPILFIILRIIQGLALGGELPGAIVFVYESVERKGIALGILFTMVFAGFTLGDVMSLFFHYAFGDLAWRAAFISGSFIALVGFYIRSHLSETKMFLALEEKQKFPLKTILENHSRALLATILIVVIVAFDGVMVSLYLPKYLTTHLGIAHEYVRHILVGVSIVGLVVIFISGFLSDFVDYIKLYKAAAWLLMFMSYPAYYLLSKGVEHNGYVLAGLLIVVVIPAISTGIFMRIICDAFSTSVRFSGVAMAYNLSFALVGGIAPLLSEVSIKLMGPVSGAAVIGVICAILTLIGIFLLHPKALRPQVEE
ncbi:MFS transporter [uncultured Shewanella sp.]|uniref:MFS transporter n=1 Tax=uncultured Shewanella sp. TaxID=173975 RepID=UPI002630FEE9|nr:MFS transporter [uncultured Shewanella sp.]